MFLGACPAVYHLLLVGFEIMMKDTSNDWQQLTSDPYIRKLINGGLKRNIEVVGLQSTEPYCAELICT